MRVGEMDGVGGGRDGGRESTSDETEAATFRVPMFDFDVQPSSALNKLSDYNESGTTSKKLSLSMAD